MRAIITGSKEATMIKRFCLFTIFRYNVYCFYRVYRVIKVVNKIDTDCFIKDVLRCSA